jgi:gamma-glutamylaminecyclotransferase
VAELVFVYGSLKRGFQHHDQMLGAIFLGDVALDGHFLVLYDGGYPALVRGDAVDLVHGELYQVHDLHLARLDEFEECPEFYVRRQVKLTSGQTAWAYLNAQKETSQFPRLAGKWEAPESVADPGPTPQDCHENFRGGVRRGPCKSDGGEQFSAPCPESFLPIELASQRCAE